MLILLLLLLYWFFFYLKKKEPNYKNLTWWKTLHPISSHLLRPVFVFSRFAILGHPNSMRATVADPDLQIRGEGGGGPSRPDWGKGEARSQKKFGSATGQFLRACTAPCPVWDRPHHRGLYAPTGFELEFKFFYVPFQLIKTRCNDLNWGKILNHTLAIG